jgi:hypothetical protein
MKANFESGSYHIAAASAETIRAFNMSFDTFNLHHPTVASVVPGIRSPAIAAQVEFESKT